MTKKFGIVYSTDKKILKQKNCDWLNRKNLEGQIVEIKNFECVLK